MSVQLRLASTIALMLGALLFGIWAQHRSDLASNLTLVQDAQQERQRLLEQLIALKGDPLRAYAGDYAPWDDMMNFVAHPDPEWQRINLHDPLRNYGIDSVWVLGLDGTLVAAVPADEREDLRELPLSSAAVKFLISRTADAHFYALTQRGLLEIRCAPIRRGVETNDMSHPRGWLVAARWWSPAYLEDFARLTDGRMRLAGPGETEPGSEDMEVVVHIPLPDWQGQTLRLLVGRYSPPVMETIRRDREQDLLLLAGFGCVMIVVVLVTSNLWVVRPLRLLRQSLGARDPAPLKALSQGRSDFARLSRAMEHAFAQEAELRQVFEAFDAIDDAVFIAESDGHRVTYVNSGAVRLFGQSREQLLGQRLDALLPADAVKTADPALSTGQLQGAGGRQVEVEIRRQRLRSPAGKELYVAVMRDITERRQMEKARLRAQRMESLGALAGGVAHDLNNMLTPVTLFLSELQDPDTRPSPSLVAGVRVSVRRSAEMLRQLLTFGRGIEGERKPVSVTSLFEETQRIIDSTFPKNIRQVTKLPAGLWSAIGDPTQLNQVLLNLCVNARDAMPDGGQLTLSAGNLVISETTSAAWQGAPPGRYVLLEVGDTGTGIPPDIIDRIFEPFFSTKPTHLGTGLGLSTTLGIVRGHGGVITVTSSPGAGTCFHIVLPAEETPQAAAIPVATPRCTGAARTVLVVEDEESIRRVLATMLGRMGFHVLQAEDGATALVRFRDSGRRVDLVMTDLSMRGMDGVEMLRRLRTFAPDVPVVIMSGRIEEDTQRELSRLGIAGVMNKPFSREELVQILGAALPD